MTPLRERLSNAAPRDAATRDALRERAAPCLGVDPRALGAFRIALALLLLGDLLVYRLPGLRAFYTDEGVLPRSTLAEVYPTLEAVSIHAVSGSARVQAALLALAAGAAVCLLVGYRTRASTAVSLVLLASLYARNPFVINGGNTILVAFLFLALFLPLDARWSLGGSRRSDRRDRDELDGRGDLDERDGDERGTGSDRRVCSLGTAVALLTLVSIYAANAVSKYRSDAWMSGVAVPRIYQVEEFVVGLGPLISERTAVLAAVNWLWIALLAASVLLLVPSERLRTGVVLSFVAAHLGMAATMRLAVFPFVMIAVLLLFLPPRVWDAVEGVASKARVPARLAAPALRSDGGSADATASAPSVPSGVRRGVRVAAAVLLVGFFVALVWWQAAGVGLVDLPASESTGGLSEVSWSFFAPNPPDTSSWYVVRATLDSGESVDALGGGAVAFDRPPDAAETYPTTLWHQFGHRTRYAGETRYRPVAAYVCERADRSVESVTVFHVEQEVGPTGPVGPPEPQKRITAAC
ncbi:HTTM domain-containing protein [Halorubrum rutilum]|uniref:HTTM domain-containing protein n=1 Tax=Halorubrum rutilum TaxID=1364933 RepID=A0ABD6AKW7_9EURY|nr:HTTM domain-containing protein [Halorubrum rutilum]